VSPPGDARRINDGQYRLDTIRQQATHLAQAGAMKSNASFPARLLRASVLFVLAIFGTGVAVPAQAQTLGAVAGSENGITLYGGYRGGGNFTDATTGQDVRVGSTASFAFALDIALEPLKQVQLFYSRQKTDLSSGAFLVSTSSVPLTIEYFHIGGTAFFDKISSGGYVVGGIGATVFGPEGPGLTNETKPSMNLGFGYMLPLAHNLGVRFEARGYATLIDSTGGMFCSNNSCLVSIKGTALYQGEVLLGLTGRF
jgi:hypothetical protein